MSISDSDRVDAGEYALGLEDAADRRRFEVALIDDPELAGVVWHWEETFRPLAGALRPRKAPARVWRAITARLFGADDAALRKMRRAAVFWRDTAIAVMALFGVAAACLVAVVVRPDLAGIGGPAGAEDWIATIVRLDGTIALARLSDDGRLVAEPVPPEIAQRAAELWLVPASGSPVSLGLLAPDGRSQISVPADAVRLIDSSTEFVVTSEPEGGSPSGQPTGARLGSGALTRI
ncbi:anti-sigma factor [Acuticoccus yangtzensis]|uniref:anti-sigma factor n=1 Tax=Acuticoccus yangtzensis TaxID=1443441 RepID=UPI000949981F|nr:anti-sigma factor [Acuticoccus yangtzensis]ORE95446.1 hypothetical protein ATO13_01270 [Stappia sp. 22II-S9-Z10]